MAYRGVVSWNERLRAERDEARLELNEECVLKHEARRLAEGWRDDCEAAWRDHGFPVEHELHPWEAKCESSE